MDLNSPTRDGAEFIGLFATYDAQTNHPKGWALSVIDKITNEVSAHYNARTGSSNWDRGKFSADELAAWDWWQKKIDITEWRRLVDEYNKSQVKKDNVTIIPYTGDHYSPGSGFAPPDVKTYGGGDNPNRSVAVSTKALVYLADQIKVVAEDKGMLIKVHETVKLVNPLPGGFAKAEILRQKIDGGPGVPGLRVETMDFIYNIRAVLLSLETKLRQMAAAYEKDEGFNAMTTNQLTDEMKDVLQQINGLRSTGGPKAP